MNIIFIHGLGSTKENSTANTLDKYLYNKTIRLSWKADTSFLNNLNSLKEQLNNIKDLDTNKDIIIAESTGAVYALELSRSKKFNICLINPVINPLEQLHQFLGELYQGSTKINFTKEILDSYLCYTLFSINELIEYNKNKSIVAITSNDDEYLTYPSTYFHHFTKNIPISDKHSLSKHESFCTVVKSINEYLYNYDNIFNKLFVRLYSIYLFLKNKL